MAARDEVDRDASDEAAKRRDTDGRFRDGTFLTRTRSLACNDDDRVVGAVQFVQEFA